MNLEAEQAIMVGDDIGERFFFLISKLYYYFMYILFVFVSYTNYLFIKMCFCQNYSTLYMYIRFLTLIQSPMWVGLNHVDFEGSWSEQGNIDQLMKVTQK